jgi:hypothetical protein
MTRYFIQRRPAKAFFVEDDHFGEPPRDRDLFVPEHVATDTGILDANGDCIMRAPNPIGFIW